MRVPFLSFVSRVTGFSTPVFGLSWQPPELDADVARRLLTFLEDRRVLFAQEELEVPHYTVTSVNEIRHVLTSLLDDVDGDSQVGQSMRAMRGACRAYLDQLGTLGSRLGPYHTLQMSEQWQLGTSLGQLRAIFGVHIAQIAVSYGIDVEEQLVELFPAADAD